MKTEERNRARRLRRDDGLSIKEIARRVGAAQSSVSVWVRDVPLTSAQRAALQRLNPATNGQLRSAALSAERARAMRSTFQAEGREFARQGDQVHAAGVMLYWAEGGKSSKNSACLSNSDPELFRYFAMFLRTAFAIEDLSLRLTCNLFADHLDKQREIEEFWLDQLRLPPSCLTKSVVNVYSKHSQKKRQNTLPYGTARLCVHSTRVVQHIFGAIQEHGGFDRPQWLG